MSWGYLECLKTFFTLYYYTTCILHYVYIYTFLYTCLWYISDIRGWILTITTPMRTVYSWISMLPGSVSLMGIQLYVYITVTLHSLNHYKCIYYATHICYMVGGGRSRAPPAGDGIHSRRQLLLWDRWRECRWAAGTRWWRHRGDC